MFIHILWPRRVREAHESLEVRLESESMALESSRARLLASEAERHLFSWLSLLSRHVFLVSYVFFRASRWKRSRIFQG